MESVVSLGLWGKLARISTDMLCTLDADGLFTHVSQASGQILGYGPDELVGRSYADFIHPDSLAATRKATGQLLEALAAVVMEELEGKKSSEAHCSN